MKAPKISIIIPVYNVRPYLERCVRSAAMQDYPNLEILLIDDGSTDGSGEMCDAYAKADARVRVIHKKNGGLADARNVGVDSSTGEMLFFLDSDDYLEAGIIKRMCLEKERHHAQVACCLFRFVEDGADIRTIANPPEVEVLSKVEVLEKMLRQADITVSAWAKLYDRDLFEGVSYPQKKLYEDLATTYRLFEKVDRAVLVHAAGYCYYVRPGSIQNSVFTAEKLVELQFANEQKEYLDARFPELKSATADRLVSCCFHVLFGMDAGTFPEERKLIIAEIHKRRLGLVFGRKTSKKTRSGCLLSYFGMDFTSWVYRKLHMRGRLL